jgi:peptidoglycan/LPS O-acetylase OafA/YrhL
MRSGSEHITLISTPPSLPTPERFHALDALRALAMLLGIYLHGALSFMVGLPRGVWPVQDIHRHNGFDVMFLYIHTFRMPLFFMLAGFFGRMVYQRIGGKDFLRQRFVRLGIPLVVGLAVFLPIMHVLYLQGATLFGPPPREIVFEGLRMNHPPTFSNRGPLLFHLWFIYTLLLVCLLATGARVLAGRVLSSATLGRVDGAMRWLVGSVWGVPVLALITLPVLSLMHSLTIDTPTTFIPEPRVLLFYGLFFGFGWLLQRQPALLSGLERRAGRQVLLVSALLFPLLLGVAGRWAQTQGQGPFVLKLLGFSIHSLITWALVLGFTGLALRHLNRPSPVMRYLADGAYWMYLAHLPLLAWLQLLFARLDMPALVKFLIVCHLAVLLLLPAYEYLVRYTIIGRVLNGPRSRKAKASQDKGVVHPGSTGATV